jgi:hypothetical protein
VFIDYFIRCIHHDDPLCVWISSISDLLACSHILHVAQLDQYSLCMVKVCIVIIIVMSVKSTAYSTDRYHQCHFERNNHRTHPICPIPGETTQALFSVTPTLSLLVLENLNLLLSASFSSTSSSFSPSRSISPGRSSMN